MSSNNKKNYENFDNKPKTTTSSSQQFTEDELYQMGLDFELLLEVEEENLESVLIQINVLCDNINSFAFFYGTLDNEINYSSIFEVNDCHDENVLDLFNKNKGIFQDLLVESETNTIHLYSKIDKEEVERLLK